MSGHSKWAGIKHKKALVDAKRGAAFGKLARAPSRWRRERVVEILTITPRLHRPSSRPKTQHAPRQYRQGHQEGHRSGCRR